MLRLSKKTVDSPRPLKAFLDALHQQRLLKDFTARRPCGSCQMSGCADLSSCTGEFLQRGIFLSLTRAIVLPSGSLGCGRVSAISMNFLLIPTLSSILNTAFSFAWVISYQDLLRFWRGKAPATFWCIGLHSTNSSTFTGLPPSKNFLRSFYSWGVLSHSLCLCWVFTSVNSLLSSSVWLLEGSRDKQVCLNCYVQSETMHCYF